MRCDLFKMLIQRYHDSELGPGEMAEYENHLSHCSECRRLHEQYAGVFSILEDMDLFEPSAAFDEKVMARVNVARYRTGPLRRFARLVRSGWNEIPAPLRVTSVIAGVFALFLSVYTPMLFMLISVGRRLVALAGTGIFVVREAIEDPAIITGFLERATNYRVAGKIVYDTIYRQISVIPFTHLVISGIAIAIVLAVFIRVTRTAWRKGETHVGIF